MIACKGDDCRCCPLIDGPWSESAPPVVLILDRQIRARVGKWMISKSRPQWELPGYYSISPAIQGTFRASPSRGNKTDRRNSLFHLHQSRS
jgi:hypothetical protein